MGIMTSMLTGTGTVTGEKADATVSTMNDERNEDVDTDQCEAPSDRLLSTFAQLVLENDGVALIKKEAPVRKLVCETSPEKQARYRAILEEIFDEKCAVWGRKVDFEPREILDILVEMRKYLESEPVFIEDIEGPVTIVGDLHGQLHDLDKMFKYHSVNYKPGYECGRFVFLGNYIQRGRQSIELFIALCILKILYPSEFILLRGEDEFVTRNQVDFAYDIRDRYPHETSRCLNAIFNGTFAWLSVCAIVGGKLFCAHGGISTNGFTKSSLRNLRKPILTITDNYLVHDMVMSDPADGLQGTCFNAARGSSIFFGEDAFAYAMDAIDCIAMFRGHTRMAAGCGITWERCITLYSAVDVNLSMNKGSFAQIAKNLETRIGIMPIDLVRHRVYRELREKEGQGHKEDVDLGTGTITQFDY